MFAILLNSRCLHTSVRRLAGVDKATLSKLRKKTGFSIMHCKNALEQFNNDLEKAEHWLREQAQKEGWVRATKLQGRPMSQGLVGILKDTHIATMIEVNCETDFVAKNSKFHDLVARLTTACHENFVKLNQPRCDLNTDALATVPAGNGKTLADIVAMEVGNIGENIATRRAVCLTTGNDIQLGCYVHLAGPQIQTNSDCIMGKYGAMLTLKQVSSEVNPELSLDETTHLICQHIVGMNPKVIGERGEEPTSEKVSRPTEADNESESKSNPDGSDEEEVPKEKVKVEENRLIYQEYLLDTSITMGEFMENNCVDVLDFVRYECGEDLENSHS
ncbi:elongation factor Ts, mitochondrial-like [Liolophura sinensis]|uniref:elongation factor Ts, mitochondrial-like n=1 Tax=Liolophura sinensis TaxID=3198878 RepID=UPI0031583CE8